MSRPEQSLALRAAARPRLLPRSGWSLALTGWMTAAMSFMAVLTLAAGMAAIALADAWRTDLAGVATVRVSHAQGDMEARIAAVTEVLRTTPGIAGTRVLSDAEQEALLTPWLGDAAGLADLPAPRLIEVELDGGGPDATALQARLDLTVDGAVYDDHAAWREPLARAATGLTALAFAATALVLATAAAAVAWAARAALVANRQIIEVVRLMGAEDDFVSAGFVHRLAARAAIGGFIGAGAGCAAVALLPSPGAEPALGLSLAPSAAGWAVLGLGVPLACAGIAWVAARGTVRLALRKLP